MRYVSLILAAGLILAVSGTAGATSWTVDAAGGKDFTTIQAAVNFAGVGDTINVYAGTYNESVGINKSNLTLRAASGRPVVTWNTFDQDVIEIFSGANGVTVQGFALKGGDDIVSVRSDDVVIHNNFITPVSSPVTTNAPGIFAANANNLTISDNWIKDTGGAGVYLGIPGYDAPVTSSLIEGNLIDNPGYTGILAFQTDSLTIDGNTIAYAGIPGVNADDGIRAVNGTDLTITCNEIYGSLGNGIRIRADGIMSLTSIWHNDIYGNGQYDVNNQAPNDTILAEDNYWGGGAASTFGLVDSDPYSTTPYPCAGSAIPEPMTMLAVGMAVAGLGGYIRKRRMA